MGNSFNKMKCASYLRQAQARLNILRSKKLTKIAKTKDDICRHLEQGNEINAKIWAETLLNEEGMIPVYDVVSTMCNQVEGRLTLIEKFGPPKDMNQTFATIIHCAPKLDVQELSIVSKMLSGMFDKQFVKECMVNYDLINPVVAQNVDFKTPEQGAVLFKLVSIAKERNIEYMPNQESQQVLIAYCLRKNIPPPIQVSYAPQYAPMPEAFNANLPFNPDMPSYNPDAPPQYNPK